MTETPPPQSSDELSARVAELEAENRALRQQGASATSRDAGSAQGRPARGRGWTVLAVLLITLGCVLAPIAVVSGWAKATLTDTDAFVETYAPLAQDPAIRGYVVDQTVVAISGALDVEGLTGQVIDGIKQLGAPPRVGLALDALRGPATRGVQSAIRDGVAAFVNSDAFPAVWERALRISHTQLLATLSDDPQALVKAEADGTIGIQLGPIVEEVKAALVRSGLTLASRIPTVERTIPIAQSDDIPTIQFGYRATLALGTWLPWVSLLMLALGVLVARRRSRALIGAAIGLSLSMGVLLAALAAGGTILAASLPPDRVPSTVTAIFYGTATEAMRDTAVATLVLGIVVAAVGWLAGPFTLPRRLRGLYLDGLSTLRGAAERRGVTTGRVGTWVYAQRRVLQTVVAIAAGAVIVLTRPLTADTIVATLLVAAALLVILTVIERPPGQQTARSEPRDLADTQVMVPAIPSHADDPTEQLPAVGSTSVPAQREPGAVATREDGTSVQE